MSFFLKGGDADLVEFQKTIFKVKIEQLIQLLEKPANQIHAGDFRIAIASAVELRDNIINHEIYAKKLTNLQDH